MRTRYTRPIVFIHSARTAKDRAFFAEARELEQRARGAFSVISFLSQPDDDDPKDGSHVAARVDKAALRELLALDRSEEHTSELQSP